MSTLAKEIHFAPAYDKRHIDPEKNYGIHGVTLTFYLRGEKGVVQFVIYTNWHLPHVQEELDNKSDSQFPHLFCHPMGADVGYHSPVSLSEHNTKPLTGNCPVLGGVPCFYDGSGLWGVAVLERLITEGEDAVWEELEKAYSRWFGIPEPEPHEWTQDKASDALA